MHQSTREVGKIFLSQSFVAKENKILSLTNVYFCYLYQSNYKNKTFNIQL